MEQCEVGERGMQNGTNTEAKEIFIERYANEDAENIDGEVEVDGLARVVWCQQTEGGRARAGVSILRENGQRPMMRVRSRAAVGRGARSEAAKSAR